MGLQRRRDAVNDTLQVIAYTRVAPCLYMVSFFPLLCVYLVSDCEGHGCAENVIDMNGNAIVFYIEKWGTGQKHAWALLSVIREEQLTQNKHNGLLLPCLPVRTRPCARTRPFLAQLSHLVSEAFYRCVCVGFGVASGEPLA
jgi:hypothetical protein